MHRDHVISVPPGFEILAETDFSTNQIMVFGKKVLSIQGHPEYSADFVTDLINMRVNSGIFSKEFAHERLKLVSSELDAALFADSILSFVDQANK